MLEYLERAPIFAGLEPSALQLLVSRAQRSVVPAGAVILKEGEPGNRFFLIESGAVRVLKNYGAPEETELARLEANDFFGEMCILETLPRTATVRAAAETSLISLSSMAFLHLYEQVPAQYGLLVLNLARDLSRRLRHLDERFAARH